MRPGFVHCVDASGSIEQIEILEALAQMVPCRHRYTNVYQTAVRQKIELRNGNTVSRGVLVKYECAQRQHRWQNTNIREVFVKLCGKTKTLRLDVVQELNGLVTKIVREHGLFLNLCVFGMAHIHISNVGVTA